MNPPRDLSNVDWRTALRSQQDGECVEVGVLDVKD
jgi:hypothetical protein